MPNPDTDTDTDTENDNETGADTGADTGAAPGQAPSPEPIRFYGTTWTDHSGHYALRRLGLGLGALVLAVAGVGVLALVFGVAGGTSGVLQTAVILVLTLCNGMAYTRVWNGYAVPAEERTKPRVADDSSFRVIKVVGFVGVLLAYMVRSVTEAPGEKLRRAEYEAAVERHRRLTRKRSGNPARRAGPGRQPRGTDR